MATTLLGLLNYFDDKRGRRDYNALLGAPDETLAPDIMGPPKQGTGLLGGDMTNEEFFARAGGLRGEAGRLGQTGLVSVYNNLQSQRAAMQRHRTPTPLAQLRAKWEAEKQEFTRTRFNWDHVRNKEQVDQHDMAISTHERQGAEEARKIELHERKVEQYRQAGIFANKKEEIAAIGQAADRFTKIAKPIYDSSVKVEQFLTRAADLGGVDNWDLTTDLDAMVAVQKALKPSEAVMSDDYRSLQEAASFVGVTEKLFNQFQKTGSFPKPVREKLYQFLQSKQGDLKRQRQDLRDRERKLIEANFERQLDPSRYFYPDARQIPFGEGYEGGAQDPGLLKRLNSGG